MNPNLKNYKATNVEIRAILNIPSDVAIKLREYSAPDRAGDSLFTTKQPRHQVWLWLVAPQETEEDGSENYEMQYNCRIGRSYKQMQSTIEGLINLLSPTIMEVELQVNISFLYNKESKVKPIIELPNKYLNHPDLPFDSIRGYHFTKRPTESKIGYNVIFDSSRPGEYYVRVIFTQSATFEAELFENCVKRAETIAKKFVYSD